MRIMISEQLPPQYTKPIRSYETRYIYTGVRRYNVETKTLSSIELVDNELYYTEEPYTGTIFSRGYATELVRVIVYSETPRVWAEELAPGQQHIFQQVDIA